MRVEREVSVSLLQSLREALVCLAACMSEACHPPRSAPIQIYTPKMVQRWLTGTAATAAGSTSISWVEFSFNSLLPLWVEFLLSSVCLYLIIENKIFFLFNDTVVL